MESTGPRSEAGKAIASLNALRHGFNSSLAVLPGIESEDEWEAHRRAIVESLTPEGYLECLLADRIALSLWRHRRVFRYELFEFEPSPSYQEQLDDFYKKTLDQPLADAAVALPTRSFPPEGYIERLQRYEAHLHRLFLKDLHELEALQSRRNAEPRSP
jgi:hypothetical protein